MLGQTWSSEIREFIDEKTGRRIRQLTSTGNNVHLYFTENSFDAHEDEIIFLSDRASEEDKAPYADPLYNLFRMDLGTGEIVQLTDEAPRMRDEAPRMRDEAPRMRDEAPRRLAPQGSRPPGVPPRRGPEGREGSSPGARRDEAKGVRSVTKTPDGHIVVYVAANQLKKLDMQTGETLVVYEETGDYHLGSPSISGNRRYVAFCRNEKVEVTRGPNYAGFKDSYYLIKDGRITLAYLDGSGWLDIFKDTHWLGHFQFCPDDSTLATFCHEGPWHLVTQRIWLLDFVSREARPCFRQQEQDSIGHEFWTQDGYIFFDDRGLGHDGTITSDRTQAVAGDVQVGQKTIVPFVGLADRGGNLVKRIEMPYYCNHYHANPDNTMLVGDNVDDLVLVDISGEKAKLELLCNHRTSWHTQSSHCHPTWSWDGSRILYASDYDGHVNLYLIKP